ncbi:MAG TPA: hypothetical protein V6C72_16390, partial [Chroococcales cyanobacterium]
SCAIPPGGTINLLTYNRCVGQALLVALNAYQEGTSAAKANASTVLGELSAIGGQLKTDLGDGTRFSNYFQSTTGLNNTKMVGNTAVNQQVFRSGYMKTGGSTNIWFNSATLPANTPSAIMNDLGNANGNQFTPKTDGNPQAAAGAMANYLPGYISYTIPGIGQVMGVPNFPQQQPHLVSLHDFDAQTTGAAAISSGANPPNAFAIDSNNKDARSGSFGGAVACAIVGAVKPNGAFDPTNQSTAFDFPAAVPGGYLIVSNLAGATMPAGYQAFDNYNNIFNNELYTGSGIEAGSAPGGAVFSTNIGQIDAWAKYNASASSNSGPGTTGTDSLGSYTADSNGRDPRLAPPGYTPTMAPNTPAPANPNPPVYLSTDGTTATQAQLSELLKITQKSTNCLSGPNQLNQTGQLNGVCNNFLGAFENEYNPGPSPSPGSASQPIYSATDMAKGLLIYHFQNGGGMHQSADINAGSLASPQDVPATGMGIYNNPNFMTEATPAPEWDMPIQSGTGTKATINNFLKQIAQEGSSCAMQNVLNGLVARCYQIQPAETRAHINTLLDNQCPMGSTLYIYRQDLTNPNSPLTISPNKPSTRFDPNIEQNPDGKTSATPTCFSNYGLVGTIVDSFANGYENSPIPPGGTNGFNNTFNSEHGGLGGDDDLHEAPFTEVNGMPGNSGAVHDALSGHDIANWQVNSGYHNFLGSLTFSNQVTGDAHFSRPN